MRLMWFALLLMTVAMAGCVKEEVVEPEVVDESDSTEVVEVVDITPYGATIRGLFGEGADSSTVTGIRLSMQNTKYITTTGEFIKARYIGGGRSEVHIEGLYADTTYYFSTNVERDGLIRNSGVYKFRTHRLTAATDTAVDVYAFGARLGLTLSEEVERGKFKGTYGVYYSLRERVIREQSTLCDSPYVVRGLRQNQTYYFRAFVMQKTATRDVYLWGDVQSFHTPVVGVETLDAEEVNTYSGKLGGYANVLFTDVEEMGVLLCEKNREVTLDSVGAESDQMIELLSPTELDERGMGSYYARPTGLKSDKRYYYRSYAKIREKEGNREVVNVYYGDLKWFRTLAINVSDDEAVDMGLSVLWASRNYGASALTGMGEMMSTESGQGKDFGAWRLPTVEEAEELMEKCNWSWGERDGVSGVEVVSMDGSAIFLPANMSLGGDYTYGVYMLAGEMTEKGYYKSLLFVKDAYGDSQCGKSADNDVEKGAVIGVRLVRNK